MYPSDSAKKEFGISGKTISLGGLEKVTFRVGDCVLKHIKKEDPVFINWVAELFNSIKTTRRFNVSRPIRTQSGTWISSDGWTAWELLPGKSEYRSNIREQIQAILDFHASISGISFPIFINLDTTYGRADQYAFDEKPNKVHRDLIEMVDQLYDVRGPVVNAKEQLIHGDLNPDNILVGDDGVPAIIDIAPYWRPVEFAVAVYAFWLCFYNCSSKVLSYFTDIPNFQQMLVRAAIRMLLIKSEFDNVSGLKQYEDTVSIILNYSK